MNTGIGTWKMIVSRITDVIGATPMIHFACRLNSWNLFLKLEKFNPGGSMKDRMARSMVDAAECGGHLQNGGTIVESSSGNTAVGLAQIAAERGYRFIAVVDHQTAKDKVKTLRALGAEVVILGGDNQLNDVATAEREEKAAEIARETEGAVLMSQHTNPANSEGYIDMAHDICEEIDTVDVIVGSIGTGGSMCGTAREIKKSNSQLVSIGVEPKGSVVFGGKGGSFYQSGTGVPPGLDLGTVIDFNDLSQGCQVGDVAAFNTCRYLGNNYGLLVGGSSGGVVYAAIDFVRRQSGSGNLVAILGDGGEKYLDTIFDDNWMKSHGLLDMSIGTDIAQVMRSRHDD